MSYISFQPNDYFNTVTYTGNSTDNRTVTGVGFQPDWTWIKLRNSVSQHELFDVVRGANKPISSNLTAAQTTETNRLKSFDSDGFTLGTGTAVNGGYTFASWNWKAGNSQGSSNTDGSINTTYTSASTTSGFSISTYVGTGSAATIGHGLGVKPSVVLVKNVTSTEHWVMYHHKSHATPEDNYLRLNTDGAVADFDMWNDTAPTNQVFSISSNGSVGASGDTYVAYCFAEKKGFSAMGSYTGNGNADGAFIYTGFKPAFVIVKRTDSSANWVMTDNKISFNGKGNNNSTCLFPSTNTAESDAYGLMLHSNGFKFSGSDSASTTVNGSGATYVYLAFAESPIVSSNGVPAVAR